MGSNQQSQIYYLSLSITTQPLVLIEKNLAYFQLFLAYNWKTKYYKN